MKTLLENAFIPGKGLTSLFITDGVITSFNGNKSGAERVIDLGGATVLPGAVDVHAHLREPGYEYKETILSATESAVKGGITRVMAMPNLKPVPDSEENLEVEEKLIKNNAKVFVYPYASLTKGEKGECLSDIEALSKRVKAFSDDGVCVNDLKLLEEGMRRVKECGGIIASHAERRGAGSAAEAEYRAVSEETELVKKTGVRYHFCHISTKKSLDVIRRAKREGLDVSIEVTPHHIALDETMIRDANWKMNPPLMSPADREAVVEAVADGTADMIATDHAPHAAHEKAVAYAAAPNGIIGFETLFSVCVTELVERGVIGIERLSELTSVLPAKRFGIPSGALDIGQKAEIIALDTASYREYTAEEIRGKAKNSPFIGRRMTGYNILTMIGDEIAFIDETKAKEEL